MEPVKCKVYNPDTNEVWYTGHCVGFASETDIGGNVYACAIIHTDDSRLEVEPVTFVELDYGAVDV